MICVIQRVTSSSVTVDGQVTGRIGRGLNILLCAVQGDTEEDVLLLSEKIPRLRIFKDENGKNNLSLLDKGYGALVVSNFTIAADYKKGNRPSYFGACEPKEAERLYEFFLAKLREKGIEVGSGIFGAEMHVDIQNDGPITLVIDSAVLKKTDKK